MVCLFCSVETGGVGELLLDVLDGCVDACLMLVVVVDADVVTC